MLAKWEHLGATYDSASRSGVADAKNIDGDINANEHADEHTHEHTNQHTYEYAD